MTDGLQRYALQILSGPRQGGLFTLSSDSEVVIGRSAEADLILAEEMVSRKHATLIAHAGELLLRDRGSTNGTFVNGERVEEVVLQEGDRILIGTTILVVIAGRELSRSSGAMGGRLEEVPLTDLLQFFHQSHKSGTLVLYGSDGLGKIHLRGGNIVHASLGDLEMPAEKAIYRLLTWQRGAFELMPEEEDFDGELKESTASFLMEGMRQLDELRRLEPELPLNGSEITLASPLPPLQDLAPEELDLLRLVHDHRELREILDRSPEPDLTAAERIVALRNKGYLNYETPGSADDA